MGGGLAALPVSVNNVALLCSISLLSEVAHSHQCIIVKEAAANIIPGTLSPMMGMLTGIRGELDYFG